jgi:hypothetical protein
MSDRYEVVVTNSLATGQVQVTTVPDNGSGLTGGEITLDSAESTSELDSAGLDYIGLELPEEPLSKVSVKVSPGGLHPNVLLQKIRKQREWRLKFKAGVATGDLSLESDGTKVNVEIDEDEGDGENLIFAKIAGIACAACSAGLIAGTFLQDISSQLYIAVSAIFGLAGIGGLVYWKVKTKK